ncbi:MAG: prolipoprotein diacylglyceryl transferase [Oscillibacter sp.]|nr:prolipoprotein diacylglyceryl transferase [Oscillibacter sp.]
MPISFPGLFGDWSWNPDPVAVHIGHGIYWYGIILAVAMLCGMFLSMKQAKRYGLTEDDVSNLVLWAVPLCILGSRTYYVLFNLDAYRNAAGGIDWGRAVAVWDGGIAIYGTVIAGVLTALGYSLMKRIPFGATADTAVLGLILGQAIGRWANLINREAFGAATTLPWRMRLWYNQTLYMEVHPTFLYESLWNFLGLILLLTIISKGRRFDGENLCFYFLWYGLGRLWIEGLRTDSLYLFHVTFFGERVRVSQALSLCLALAGGAVLWFQVKVRKKTAEGLYVNRLAAAKEEAAPDAETKTETGTEAQAAPEAGTEAQVKGPASMPETPDSAEAEQDTGGNQDTDTDKNTAPVNQTEGEENHGNPA